MFGETQSFALSSHRRNIVNSQPRAFLCGVCVLSVWAQASLRQAGVETKADVMQRTEKIEKRQHHLHCRTEGTIWRMWDREKRVKSFWKANYCCIWWMTGCNKKMMLQGRLAWLVKWLPRRRWYYLQMVPVRQQPKLVWWFTTPAGGAILSSKTQLIAKNEFEVVVYFLIFAWMWEAI